MGYIPYSKEEITEMVEASGSNSLEGLFDAIPAEARLKNLLNIPSATSEMEINSSFKQMAEANTDSHSVCFRGAGAYDHYVPSVIDHLISRGEFFTAYTPYQPEASQGTLQYIFEFQSLVCAISGMDIANASMYDGPNAFAEAALMACRCTDKEKVLVSRSVHPQYREVLKTYCSAGDIEYIEIPIKGGVTDLEQLAVLHDDSAAGVLVQTPNYFGILEPLGEIEKTTHSRKSLLVVASNPISLGKLKTPGEYQADICVMEGQPLGNPLNFGGPYLGIMACRQSWVRKMPGRVVGMAEDTLGRRGFVLTLQAREQHIRRSKATSNICSNQSLNSLCATLYLSSLGKVGFQKLWDLNYQKAHYAAVQIAQIPGFSLRWNQGHFFNEFTVQCSLPTSEILDKLSLEGIQGGYELAPDYPELKNCLLFCVTEKRTRKEIDKLAEILRKVSNQ